MSVDFECRRGFDSLMKVVMVVDDQIWFTPPMILIAFISFEIGKLQNPKFGLCVCLGSPWS